MKKRTTKNNAVKLVTAETKKRIHPSRKTKAIVNIRLDNDIIEMLRWQARVNALLRAAVNLTG